MVNIEREYKFVDEIKKGKGDHCQKRKGCKTVKHIKMKSGAK